MNIAVVGATGAVGVEMLRVLEERDFPFASLRVFASARSAGKTVSCKGAEYVIETLDGASLDGLDIALFSAGSDTSRGHRKAFNDAGCVIIDNSSAFRMDVDTPLVIPEINGEDIRDHHGVIAVPNCSAIVMLMAIYPIYQLAPVKRIVVSTYQAVSGAGAKALRELIEQTRDVLEGKEAAPKVLPHQIAFNIFSHNTAINDAGYNGEEWKVIHEAKKILHDEKIAITATCVRVPVARAHSESINIEFDGERPSLAAIRNAIDAFLGVRLVEDREANHFPMPIDASGKNDVLVGRLRYDVSNPHAVELFASGDQLRKGAALNAIQIAEYLVEHDLAGKQ